MRRNSARRCLHKEIRKAAAVCLVLAATGCSMPDSMEVRAGSDPRYSDDNVRFRATLYVRVFKICKNMNDDTDFKLAKHKNSQDSLYRFRMTGKAHALSNAVHFESGTLHKNEIERFGQTVSFEDSKKPEIAKLDENQDSEIFAKINTRIDEISEALVALKTGVGTPQIVAVDGVKLKPDGPCPDSYVESQEFALRGPEGWKFLSKGERLVLAMSTTAKPLISSLQALAAMRRESQGVDGKQLALEQARILEFLLKLQKGEIAPEKAAEEAINLLAKGSNNIWSNAGSGTGGGQ